MEKAKNRQTTATTTIITTTKKPRHRAVMDRIRLQTLPVTAMLMLTGN